MSDLSLLQFNLVTVLVTVLWYVLLYVKIPCVQYILFKFEHRTVRLYLINENVKITLVEI